MSGSYRDLNIWKKSMKLTMEIYRHTQDFPSRESYGLTSQMRRAAVSICSNIAEGKGRSSDQDFLLFLCHARGSVQELETQTLIAKELGYLQGEAADKIEPLTNEAGKMLNGLISSLRGEARPRRLESSFQGGQQSCFADD